MTKHRFAIVGCGRISKKHITAIQSFSDRAEVVAICDPNPAKRSALVKEIQFPVAQFNDMEAMFKAALIDVVCILTPSGEHAKNVMFSADFVKNVVVEKPMSLLLSDADQMIRKCDEKGVRLFVVKQNRYNPPVTMLKKALDQGRFGKLIMGTVRVRWARHESYYTQDAWRGTWASDGGVFSNQASHHVDLLTWLMGPPHSVFAKTDRFLAPIEAEDAGVAVLKFKNGALGVIEATTCARPKDLEGSVTIMGEKGVVEIAGFAVNQLRTWQFTDKRPEDAHVFESSTEPPDVYGFGHQEYYRDVLESLDKNLPPVVDGVAGRVSLELITAIYESSARSQEIFLDGFKPEFSRLGRR